MDSGSRKTFRCAGVDGNFGLPDGGQLHVSVSGMFKSTTVDDI